MGKRSRNLKNRIKKINYNKVVKEICIIILLYVEFWVVGEVGEVVFFKLVDMRFGFLFGLVN